MTNQDRLTKAIDRLQHERAVFFSKFERLDQKQLDYKPSRNSWSAGQIAHHVALGEAVWQAHLKSVLSKGDRERGAIERVSLEQIPFSSRVIPDFLFKSPFVVGPVSFFVNLMPRPVQSMLFAVPLFNMDASVRMQPKLGMSRAQIVEVLEETRKTTLKLVEPFADWDLTRFRVNHPLVGNQDIYGVLELLAAHEQRHSLQIDSIKKQPGFPKPEDKARSV
jgi:hypothetical protein